MLHINTIILRHHPHLLFQIIIHPLAHPNPLLDFAEVKVHVTSEQHEFKNNVTSIIAPALR